MKKLILTLSILLIATSLFAADNPQFSLNAQVKGILFHGFTTETYKSSDAILAGQGEIGKDATVSGLNLTSNAVQPVGSYIIYATNTIQSRVTFETTPLQYTVQKDTYFVPYQLTYTMGSSNKIEKIQESVGGANKATVSQNATPEASLIKRADVIKTKDNSTGLRYGILNLSVKFAGTENISFGLPEAGGEDFYTGTITAMINVK